MVTNITKIGSLFLQNIVDFTVQILAIDKLIFLEQIAIVKTVKFMPILFCGKSVIPLSL